MIVPVDSLFDVWGAVSSFLFAANMALISVIYKGVVRRMDKQDKILANVAGGFVALATTLSPDKSPGIIRDFVAGLVQREGR